MKKIILKISFFLLALIPLLKPNINSISIIICTFLTILFAIKYQKKILIKAGSVLFTLPFFMFLTYELFSENFNLNRVLLGLPFLIFPILFSIKPNFIDEKVINKSFLLFQISVVVQSFIYVIVFLKSNSIDKIFFISNENIPFFREYVTSNYLIEMHPTYFSSFLLFSITISLFKFKSHKIFNFLNLIITTFFLMLFSSRIILLLLIVTILSFIVYMIIKNKKKTGLIVGALGITILVFIFNSKVVKERFLEIKEQINTPIIGSHYNSSNTRVAIYKCDFLLIKKLPFFGFGDNLQDQLNKCYAENNESDFYKINVFNTHNYYLNLILYGGWLFFIFFMLYLFFVFKKIKQNPFHLFIFFQFLLINFTENYFSRHYGIVLFCYFTTLFTIINKDESYSRIKYI